MQPNWGATAVGCLFLLLGLMHVLVAERMRRQRGDTGRIRLWPVSWAQNPRAASLRASGYVALVIGAGLALVALLWPEILS